MVVRPPKPRGDREQILEASRAGRSGGVSRVNRPRDSRTNQPEIDVFRTIALLAAAITASGTTVALAAAQTDHGPAPAAAGPEPVPPSSPPGTTITEAVDDQAAPCDEGVLSDDLGTVVTVVDGQCQGGWALVSTGGQGDTTMLVAQMGARWGMVTGMPSTMCRQDLLDAGAPATVVDAVTLACNGTTPVVGDLGPGDSYGRVGRLQRELMDRGLAVTQTNQYDDATKAAVIQLQNDLGLTPDGLTGPMTQAALGIGFETATTFGSPQEFAAGALAALNDADSSQLPNDASTGLVEASVTLYSAAPVTAGDPVPIPGGRVIVPIVTVNGNAFGACVTTGSPMRWCGVWDMDSLPVDTAGETVSEPSPTATLAPAATEPPIPSASTPTEAVGGVRSDPVSALQAFVDRLRLGDVEAACQLAYDRTTNRPVTPDSGTAWSDCVGMGQMLVSIAPIPEGVQILDATISADGQSATISSSQMVDPGADPGDSGSVDLRLIDGQWWVDSLLFLG